MGLAVGAVGRTEYAVQPVADVPVAGRVWDLSHAEPVGNEFVYRVEAGVPERVWSPVKRFDFVTTRGDSVLQTCAETRAYRAVFTPGILRGMPGVAAGWEPFDFSGRIHQSQFVTGNGTAAVAPAVKGTLVTLSGDTIAGATLYHDTVTMRWSVSADSVADFSGLPDSVIHTTIVESYRIMSAHTPFPYAMKRVDTTLCGGAVVSRDSMAWALSEPSREMAERKSRSQLPDDTDLEDRTPGDEADDLNGGISIDVDGRTVTVSGGSTAEERIVISDMLGRIYLDESVVAGPSGCTVSAAELPRGEYLVQVIPTHGGKTVIVKVAL